MDLKLNGFYFLNMHQLIKIGVLFLQRLHWLNIDIIIGALGLHIWFQIGANQPINGSILLGLGSAIGFIYTVDHLLDSNPRQVQLLCQVNSQNIPNWDRLLSPRRAFHYQHILLLRRLCLFYICTGILSLFLLPSFAIKTGTALLCGCGLYLYGSQKWKLLTKEPLVAFGYTAGILLYIWTHTLHHFEPDISYKQFTPSFWYWASLLFGIALSNLMVFSWFDYSIDQKTQQNSWAIQWGQHSCYVGSWICLIGTSLLLLIGSTPFELISSTLSSPLFIPSQSWQNGTRLGMAVMICILVGLISFPQWSQKDERYRWIGDGIFLISWLLIGYWIS